MNLMTKKKTIFVSKPHFAVRIKQVDFSEELGKFSLMLIR